MARGVQLDMTHGQGSVRHFQEAAFVGSMQKVLVPVSEVGEQNVRCIQFAEQKQRHNAMEDRTMLLKHELSRMYISKEEVVIPNDAEEEVKDDNDSPKQPQGKVMAPWEAKGGS
jgi:hypothetical protein